MGRRIGSFLTYRPGGNYEIRASAFMRAEYALAKVATESSNVALDPRYADQNDSDHQILADAIGRGSIEVEKAL